MEAAHLTHRKAAHLEVCLDPAPGRIDGAPAYFDGVRLPHRAAPELDAAAIRLDGEWLGRRLALPFFISCMTGGSEGGYRLNREFAAAAQELGIPVGLGSLRILLRKPEVLPHFQLRALAPDVPVLANIGAVQARDLGPGPLIELAKRVEADVQVIHFNPGQELFQPDGDRDFRGLKDAVRRFIEASPLPVVVKETGFGFSPSEVRGFVEAGAAAVDLAGSGGTNWLRVEARRLPDAEAAWGDEFADWGWPTAPLLAATARRHPGAVLASGGLRGGMDAAKSLALGARLAGTALPVLRAAHAGGAEAVVRFFRGWERVLRTAMALTGSPDLAAFARLPLSFSPAFRDRLAELEADAQRLA